MEQGEQQVFSCGRGCSVLCLLGMFRWGNWNRHNSMQKCDASCSLCSTSSVIWPWCMKVRVMTTTKPKAIEMMGGQGVAKLWIVIYSYSLYYRCSVVLHKGGA
eukprot:2778157-Amphidinium_carterae.1